MFGGFIVILMRFYYDRQQKNSDTKDIFICII